MEEDALVTHTGGCHCGAVRWCIDAPAHLQSHTCNCSICAIQHYQHLIVPKHRFTLQEGAHLLSTYTFGSGEAKHYFCSICGVNSFYIPRSNPDGVSVHARCIKPDSVESITDEAFDGRHWEDNAHTLAHLSKA